MFSLFVDMFFVLSGYVISFVYLERITDLRGFGRFMQLRLARLVPLHWATLAFFVSLGMVSSALHISANHSIIFDYDCLPANILLLHATGLCPHASFNGPSWSISAEMVMYLISPAIFWALRRRPAALLGAVILVWAGLTGLDYYQGARWNVVLWPLWATKGLALRALPAFMYGAWLFGIRQHLPRFEHAGWAMWASVLGFVCGCYFRLPILYLLLLMYAAVSFGVIADERGVASKPLRALAAGGQLTYSSYMLHPVVSMILVSIVTERLLHLQGLWKNLAVAVTFCAVWPIAYVSLCAFERPLRRWVGGLGQRHGTGTAGGTRSGRRAIAARSKL
jgi:peptidoglycan/LPS O-acetylase OafA/YrhL